MNNNTVVCSSTHLTSFAVLVSRTGTTDPLLSVVSYIGCVISILCLLATIFCLIAFRYASDFFLQIRESEPIYL